MSREKLLFFFPKPQESHELKTFKFPQDLEKALSGVKVGVPHTLLLGTPLPYRGRSYRGYLL
jgi:hypothetical protein